MVLSTKKCFKVIITSFFLLFSLSSCSLFHEDMTEVNALIENEDYASAIIKLGDMDSSYSKKLNSKVHVMYASSVLKNLKQDKDERYSVAKEILEKAASLDPKNKEAKLYYLMVLKLSNKA